MNILEFQVIPSYYSRNSDGEPEVWTNKAKASMKSVLPQFNTIRMALDYLNDSYAPAARQGRRLAENHFEGARELAHWKKQIREAWPSVRARLARPLASSVQAGEAVSMEVAVHLNGLDAGDVVVECVLGSESTTGEFIAQERIPFSLVGQNPEGETLYKCDLFDSDTSRSAGGLQQFKVRVFPSHALLSHPFECGRMLWL
jgi:starch phosphorylase